MGISDWSSYVCSSDLCTLQLDRLIDQHLDLLLVDLSITVWFCETELSRLINPNRNNIRPALLHGVCALTTSVPELSRSNLRISRQISRPIKGFVHPASALHMGRSEEHTSELQSLMRISY